MPDLLDLDAQRAQRREASGEPSVIRLGGASYPIPAELPLDVLAPVRRVDLDLSVLLAENINVEQTVRRMLVANPAVIQQAFEALRDALFRLVDSLTAPHPDDPDAHTADCPATAFLRDGRPSTQDLLALGRGLAAQYGVSLGESSGSPAAQASDGTTSSVTSNGGTDSTPALSTTTLAAPDS